MSATNQSNREKEIFEQVLELPTPEAQQAGLEEACGGDDILLARLRRLLRAHSQAESFLPGQPVAAGALTAVAAAADALAAGDREAAVGTEQAGDRIGRYRLLEKIGEGGMGIVYMAEQEEPVRRKVALKVIRPGMDSLSVTARFEAERQALALMDHPNIARVLDAGTTGQATDVGDWRSEVGNQKPEVGNQEADGGNQKAEVGPPTPGFQSPPSETDLTPDRRPPTAKRRPPIADLRAPTSDPGRPFFVMELVRGTPITDYCAQQNLSTRERLDLFMQVCSAVQHAHQKGIIHRDLKPSNILVTEIDGRPVPKVIDFGIARATGQQLTDKTLFTQFAQFIGTPAYMSPEQAALSGTDIDTRSDVYSLGVLLYELLTSTTPFDARDLLEAGFDEMRRIIRETEPPKPSTRITQAATGSVAKRPPSKSEIQNPKRSIESDLDWIVMKCLEKDRARRYATAIGLAQDIERHLASEPVTARPASAAYRFRKMVRRNKAAVAAGAAVLAALVIGLGISLWQSIEKSRALDRAQAAEMAQSEERRKAEAEAEKSKQVAQFLKDMLRGVAPSVALGDDTKMLRKILDQTAERIGEDLKDQPEVEAELRTIVGKVYDALGDYEKASAMLSEALTITKKLHGEEHKDFVHLLNAQAQVLAHQGELDQAETMLRQALDIDKKLAGPDGDVSTSLNNLGLILGDRGKYLEAEKIHLETLAMNRKFAGNESEDVATSLSNLAVVLQGQQKPGEAETLLREALEIETKLFGKEHPATATTLNNLANVVQMQNRLSESEDLFRDLVPLQRKLRGDAHPNVAAGLNGLGLALFHQDRAEEAEPFLKEAVEIERKARTRPHPQTANIIGNLGRVMETLSRFDEAESLYREAVTIYSKMPGPEHPAMNTWRNQLFNLLVSQEKWPALETLMRESLASARRASSGGEAGAAVAEALIYLAYSLRHQQKFPEAETLLVEAHEALQKLPEAPRELHREAFLNSIHLYESWDKPDKAAEWRQRLAVFEKADAVPKTEPEAEFQGNKSNR